MYKSTVTYWRLRPLRMRRSGSSLNPVACNDPNLTVARGPRTTWSPDPSGLRKTRDRGGCRHGQHRVRRRWTPQGVGGGGRQGAEEKRDRLSVELGHRRRLDRARLFAGGDAWLHRRGDRRRRARACGTTRVIRADAADRRGLQVPQPSRSRCGHYVRVDHARARPGHRLGQRLGDLPLRRARDGLAGGHRRHLYLQAVWLHRTKRIAACDHHRRGRVDRR